VGRFGSATCVLAAAFRIGVLAALTWAPCPLFGQADRATIEGIVSDADGAPIAAARILIVRIETNDEILLSTNDSGRYVVPNLPTGLYRVRAAREGFRAAELNNVRLPSQATVRADFSLQLGSVATRMAVNLHAIGIPPCLPPLDPGAKAGSDCDYQSVKAE
jgi:hypothetical protein